MGQLPCLEISSTVTAYGREMIESTKQQVEAHYTKANGYEFDSQVTDASPYPALRSAYARPTLTLRSAYARPTLTLRSPYAHSPQLSP